MKKIRTELEFVDSSGMNFHMLDNSGKMKKQGVTRIMWENPDPLLLITPELPSIALQLLKGKIGAVQSPIAGVSIISVVPIETALQTYKALPSSDRESFYASQFDKNDRYVQLELSDVIT